MNKTHRQSLKQKLSRTIALPVAIMSATVAALLIGPLGTGTE